MKRFFLITYCLTIISIHLFAQDTREGSHSLTINIPEISLLDLEGSTSITIAPSNPTEAGLGLDFSSAVNSNIWLNYTSIVATGKTRNVSVQISSGSVPSGLSLKVTASNIVGNGQGVFGTPLSQVTLSALPQNIITGIGSAYTGNGTNNGHRLNYSLNLLSADSYSQIVQGNTTVNVTYTITEDN